MAQAPLVLAAAVLLRIDGAIRKRGEPGNADIDTHD